MADTKAKEVKAAAPAVKPKKKIGKPRNYSLGNGVYRFSRTRMFHKKAIYKFLDKKTPKKVVPKKRSTVMKTIGGEKNGGTRTVLLKKRRANYPTTDPIKPHPSKKCFKDHKRHLKVNYTKGTVLILLAGKHKGKRVVFLKQLKSGLLLVTGPFKINACPLRRVNQIYTIATSAKLDLSDFKVPKHLNDDYFKRQREKRAKKEEGDIFAKKKEGYKPSDKRKEDQKVVDDKVIDAVRKHPDKKYVFAYLGSMFGLRSSQYPHRMKF
ncbi:60S ribosomal protein L6 [Copidosoma floridanum]|uniref:60S ribosomal protein L6 n=1 Tax=Copidosoma floridanum TaxID=29053 RepID=UPI0006C97985|nr:60S ribosomal protein L6 [Copidosoma floridanum]XP_014219428.1 60S ribosomal protein L6 [Copidosoma floridanum]XP_023248423.1 60S ribosomal protein L6 [Copidosoma floridanum]